MTSSIKIPPKRNAVKILNPPYAVIRPYTKAHTFFIFNCKCSPKTSSSGRQENANADAANARAQHMSGIARQYAKKGLTDLLPRKWSPNFLHLLFCFAGTEILRCLHYLLLQS